MKQNIIIIGAGLSGLYLAYLLQEKYSVTIVEARKRIGGRIYSIDGHDMGPSWIWSHHKHLLSLAKELDLTLFTQYMQGDALYDTKDNLERFRQAHSISSARVEGSLTNLVTSLYEKLILTNIILSEEIISITRSEKNVEIHSKTKNYEAAYVISTLPTRLAAKLHYSPPLHQELLLKLQTTPTWMGNSAKCVIEFKENFWRKKHLSGFAFSHIGPLGEIHDACTKDKAALFGFVQANANMETFEEKVRAQIFRLFGEEVSEIIKIYLVDWREEFFTSSIEDKKTLSAHPNYGIDTNEYSKQVFFSSTEFSSKEGGYLEGAIIRAKTIASKFL